MRNLTRLLAASSTILLTSCALLGTQSRGRQFLPIEDPGVRTGVLENGFTYFIRANPEPEGRAELRLVVNAGSVLEDSDQRGLAHVVEHMAFNGTRSFEGPEIVNYLESIGMRFGPDINAYTSFDETVYMLTLPTDSAGVLETGLQILEEWATSIAFDSLQIEQERSVVYEEWRLGQGAGSRIQNEQFPTLTVGSRYAERLPIGTPRSLRTFEHDALRRFYREWYRPDLMAVVAVGDFDADYVEARIRERFGRIPPSEVAPQRREFPIPSHEETMISVAADPELTSSSISVYLKRQPEPWRDEQAYRDWIINSLAGSMLINRLSEYTQTADSPFLDVSSFQGRFVRTLSTFVMNARVPNGRVTEGLRALLEEVERAQRYGFTTSELERERLEMLRVMQQRYAERDKMPSSAFAAEYVSHFLYGGTILGTETEYQLYQELIPSITISEVNSAARDWTGSEDRVILVSTPESDDIEVPSFTALQRIVESVPNARLSIYRDSISDAPLLSQAPTPGRVVNETEIEEIGVVRWELSNGATMLLKSTDFREEEILFAARSPGGTSLVPDDEYIPALTATAVVQAGGIGSLSANDLRKRLAGRLVGVGADISERYEGLSGAASPRDLEMLFQLIYLKFTAPRADSTAFLAYQAQARSSLANRAASPEVAFRDTLQMTLTQNHPRARPPSVEMFDELDMARSFEIYQERFADASDFTFYLVGSFQLDAVRPLVERYVASLPSLNRNEEPRDLGIRPPRGVIRKEVRRGMEPRATTQIVFTGDSEFNRQSVISIRTLADVLRIRLRETLREDLGGTYGVSVQGAVTDEPYPSYQFSIGFGSDPARTDELIAALFADIDDLRANGPSAEDLAKVREMTFRTRETSFRENSFWIRQLLTYNRFGWDLAEMPPTADRDEPIEPERVREAAERFLDERNYVQISLLPQSGNGANTGRGGTSQFVPGIH